MGRTAPLAIHNFVEVVRVCDVRRFQSKILSNTTTVMSYTRDTGLVWFHCTSEGRNVLALGSTANGAARTGTMARFDMPSFPLRLARDLLRRINYRLNASTPTAEAPEPFDQNKLQHAEDALRGMPAEDAGAKAYLGVHIPRLARTLALVPPPGSTSRVLELGCYMQITPLLDRLCGYREVRGAYYGKLGRVDTKRVPFADGEFACQVDHFDA